jgi:hypothetical protein
MHGAGKSPREGRTIRYRKVLSIIFAQIFGPV